MPMLRTVSENGTTKTNFMNSNFFLFLDCIETSQFLTLIQSYSENTSLIRIKLEDRIALGRSVLEPLFSLERFIINNISCSNPDIEFQVVPERKRIRILLLQQRLCHRQDLVVNFCKLMCGQSQSVKDLCLSVGCFSINFNRLL